MMLLTITSLILSTLGLTSASCSVSSSAAKVDANDPVAYKVIYHNNYETDTEEENW